MSEQASPVDDGSRGECSKGRLGCTDYRWPRGFVEPAWGGPWLVYVVWRAITAIYFTTLLVHMAFHYQYGPKWLLYLSHWSYMVLTLNLLLQLWLCMAHYLRAKMGRIADEVKLYETLPLSFSVMWVLQNITLSTAPLASVTYWVAATDVFSIDTLTLHVVVTAYVVLDVFLTGIPVRLLHAYQPLSYVTVYIIVTLIYFAAGGTDKTGQHEYIYAALDYHSQPLRAGLSVLALVLATLVCHCVMYLFYRIKVACECHRCCCGSPGHSKGETTQLVEH